MDLPIVLLRSLAFNVLEAIILAGAAEELALKLEGGGYVDRLGLKALVTGGDDGALAVGEGDDGTAVSTAL